MNQLIEEIIHDLYALDKDLITYDAHVRKIVEQIIATKPDTQFDDAFKLQLRSEIMQKIAELKENEKTEVEEAPIEKEYFLKNFFSSRWVFVAPVFAVVMVMIVLGYAQYNKNGGIYITKQNVQFALSPTQADIVGVAPETHFILRTSKDVSHTTIKKVIAFDPEIEFTVKKKEQSVSFIPSARAAENVNDGDLSYQYEIIPTEKLTEDQIYKITVNNDKIADRDYQWAFQVKAPFGVVSSIPGDKGVGVPVESGIEIQFNRQLSQDISHNFSITPSIKGEFDVRADRLYFHPTELLVPKTIYTVTVEKGSIAKDNGDVMENDYAFAFETGSNDSDTSFYDYTFELGESTVSVTPDMHPMVSILYDTKGTFDVSLYKLENMEDYMHRVTLQNNWDLMWTDYHDQNDLSAYKPAEDHKILSIQGELIDDMYFDIPENLANGYYFFTITKNDITRSGWVVSSDIAHYYSLSEDNGMMWIYDFMNKKPIQNARITLRNDEQNVDALGQSNNDGLAMFTVPKSLEESADETKPQFFVITSEEGKSVAIGADSVYYSKGSAENYYWTYLSTDKNKYHKTDKINYWGIIKSRNSDRINSAVTVGLYQGCPNNVYSTDSDSEPIIVQELSVSDFDTISGEMSLENVPASSYCLAVVDHTKKETITTQWISVESYQKPAYQITVTPSTPSIYADDKMTFDVRASFYDGTPVSLQKLKYSLIGIESLDGELILDESGNGKFEYQPKYDDSYIYYPVETTITFSPAVAEEGDMYGRAHVNVFGPNIYVSSEEKKIASDTYEVRVHVNEVVLQNHSQDEETAMDSYIGDGVKDHSVNAKLIELTYRKKEVGEYYDYITKTQKKEYEYTQEEKTIEKFSGKTNNDGDWVFEKSLAVNPDISYKISFESNDQDGHKSVSDTYVYPSITENDHLKLEMTGGKQSAGINYFGDYQDFSYGDTVKLSLMTSDEDRALDNKMLIYRYQNNIMHANVVNGNTYEETFTKDLAPSVSYRAVILTQYGFQETYDAGASVFQDDHALTIEIIPSQEKYKPGDKADVAVHIVDVHGNPVVAEVNISVVDEALFQNNYDWNTKILQKLYQKIFTYLTTDYTQYASRSKGDAGGGGGGDDRSSFVDVAHFENVVTNKDGNANFTFDVPDNLTGWRVMARAFDTQNMSAGQKSIIVPTSLPFFVDVNIGDLYLSGDEPQMKIRFFGEQYDKEQPVTYSVISEGLHIDETKTTNNPINDFLLGKMQTGEYQIKITATQGDKNDSLIRQIHVANSASQKRVTKVYPITSDLHNIKGNSDGYTDIVFTDMGKAKFHNALLQNAGVTGVRLDQIVASHFAKELLTVQYEHSDFTGELSLRKYESGDDAVGFGLQLLPYGGLDIELSAKVADIAKQDVSQDDLISYFEENMYNVNADIHRTSKALYGLASLDENVLYKVDVVKSFEADLTIEDKIYLALAEYKNGDVEGARRYYENEIKKHIIIDNDQFAWIESVSDGLEKEKLTATLGILVSYIDDRPMAEKVWHYMETHAPQRDVIDLEQVMMIASEIQHISQKEASCTVSTNSREFFVDLSDDKEKTLHVSQDELASLRFTDIKGDIVLIASHDDLVQEDDSQKNNPAVSLTRSYEVDGKRTNTFKEGDIVEVRLTPKFESNAENGGYQIVDVLPSGLKPATAVFDPMTIWNDPEIIQNDCDRIWYVDRLDDNRVTFSFDSNYVKEHACADFSIRYYARVASKGVFGVDHAMMQSTQNRQNYFITNRDQITIK